MHYPCLDKAIPGHETLQTMEVNIMERKHQGNTKKAAQATSKQDGQFMAINAAQAEQDMDQENMLLPKLPLPASERKQKKADQTSTKRVCTIRVLTKPYLGMRLCKQWKSI